MPQNTPTPAAYPADPPPPAYKPTIAEYAPSGAAPPPVKYAPPY